MPDAHAAAVAREQNVGARLRRRRIPSLRILLGAYGVLAAVVAAAVLHARFPDDFQWAAARGAYVEQSVPVLAEGGPPLLGKSRRASRALPPARTGRWIVAVESANPAYPGTFSIIGLEDNQGLVLYLPVLGNFLGESDSRALLKGLFLAVFAPLFLLYPLVFFALFRSVLAAVVSPWLLLVVADRVNQGDTYWVPAWVALAGLPALFLLALKPWTRWSLVAVTALMVVASIASSIRLNAGLPLFIAAAAVTLLRERGWTRKIAAVLVVLVAYVSVSNFTPERIRAERDSAIGHPGLSDTYPVRHNVWHTVYIGLGYFENPYGITFADDVAHYAADRAKPGISTLSPEYEKTMRDLVFEFARAHPQFVANTIVRKARYVLADARDSFPGAWLLVPALVIASIHVRRIRAFIALAAPALVLNFASPALSVPIERYELGWIGAVGLLWILAVVGTIAVAGNKVDALLASRPERRRAAVRSFLAEVRAAPRWRFGLSIAGTFLIVLALLRVEPSKAERDYVTAATRLVPSAAAPSGSVVKDWRFRDMPRRWGYAPDVTLTTDGSRRVVVETAEAGFFAPQMWSEDIRLPPGVYEVWVDAGVLDGGLHIGVLDRKTDGWINSGLYWSGQRIHDGRMAFSFELKRPTVGQVVLANWAPGDGPSRWTVERILITKTTRRTSSIV